MDISPNNRRYLEFIKDIYEVSASCATTTYIWGGFTLDILKSRFPREHHDLDGFTLNLLDVLPQVTELYEDRGYETEFNRDFDILGIRKEGLHASFNRLESDGDTAMWRHIGNEGTVYFPMDWLDKIARDFYGTRVFLAGAKLEYCLKTNIRIFNAEWVSRDKDNEIIKRLEEILAAEKSDPEEFLTQIWSYNPFWVKRGYPQYAMPVVARPLLPHDKKP